MALEQIRVLDPQGVQDLSAALLRKTELKIDNRILKELSDAATDSQVPSAVLVKSLIEALQAKDTELSERVDQIRSEVGEDIGTDLSDLTTRVDNIESTVGEHETRITDTSNKADNNEKDIVSLNEAIAQLNTTVAGLTHLKIKTVVGDITTVEDPQEDVLYFQKDNEEDKTWVLYIYKAAVEEYPEEYPEASPNTYFKTDGAGAITGLTDEGKAATEIVIPAEIDGVAVTRIGSDAFKNNTILVSIRIPDSVTEIGSSAFEGCSSLVSINIPNGVTEIKMYTFQKCTSLTSLTIPEGVTTISAYAFTYCSALESVVIPSSVNAINGFAFGACTNLKSVTIPEGVEIINQSTFYGCSALESIVIPSSVTEIANAAFTSCTSLNTVNYTGTEEQWNAITIGTGNDPLTNANKVYNYINETPEALIVNTSDGQWIVIGDTSVDLVDYWRKDDIDAMKEALGMKDIVPMTTEQINAAVDAAFNSSISLGDFSIGS